MTVAISTKLNNNSTFSMSAITFSKERLFSLRLLLEFILYFLWFRARVNSNSNIEQTIINNIVRMISKTACLDDSVSWRSRITSWSTGKLAYVLITWKAVYLIICSDWLVKEIGKSRQTSVAVLNHLLLIMKLFLSGVGHIFFLSGFSFTNLFNPSLLLLPSSETLRY